MYIDFFVYIGVIITLWNTDAENFSDHLHHSVIVFKNAKIVEYNGKKSLSMVRETVLTENPSIPEADKLKIWYNKQNKQLKYKDDPEEHCTLTNIEDIANVPLTNSVSVVGVIFNVDHLNSYIKKDTDKEIKRRDITLVDSTEVPIIFTLWNTEAENFSNKKGDVILINNAVIKEFQEIRSLSHDRTTTIIQNPEIPENEILKTWFQNQGEQNIYNKIIKMAFE